MSVVGVCVLEGSSDVKGTVYFENAVRQDLVQKPILCHFTLLKSLSKSLSNGVFGLDQDSRSERNWMCVIYTG